MSFYGCRSGTARYLACPHCKTKVELVKAARRSSATPCNVSSRSRMTSQSCCSTKLRSSLDTRLDSNSNYHFHFQELQRILGAFWYLEVVVGSCREHPPDRLRLIGDVVFTTPIPRALKRVFPDAHVTYLVESAAAPVVARNPSVDDVIIVPRRRGMQRVLDDLNLGLRLRRRKFDLVIDLHGGPRSSWLAFATRAPQRIGYAIKGRSWMYTAAVPRARELRARHSVVNQGDLLQAIAWAR